MNDHPTARQVRAARALIGWSQSELAKKARIAASTLADFERGHRVPVANNMQSIRAELEAAGVSFVGGGAVFSVLEQPPGLNPAGSPIRWIEASDLGDWSQRIDGRAEMSQLISRLITATCRNAAVLRFPSGDSVQFAGWDGTCQTPGAVGLVPSGTSAWEIGTQEKNIRSKADDDYRKRCADPGHLDPSTSTFIFVTSRRWPAKDKWARARTAEGPWREVQAFDADDIVHWLDCHPAVACWLAIRTRKRPRGVLTLPEIWTQWSHATRPPFNADLMIAGRDEEVARTLRWLRTSPAVLPVKAESPEEAIAFLHAALAELPLRYFDTALSRILVATDEHSARELGDSVSPLVIALSGADAGLANSLAEKGHHVFLALAADSAPAGDAIELPRARRDHIEEALEGMGLARVDAQCIAADCARSLTVIRRLIPAAPGRLPVWARSAPACPLIAAILAGGWDETIPGDRAALTTLSGGTYEEFVRDLVQVARSSDSPLRKSGTAWRVGARRDAWMLLAPHLTDADIEQFLDLFQDIFSQRDPHYALNSNERFLAGMDGRRLVHSRLLRQGMAETLILMSTHATHAKHVTRCEDRVDAAVGTVLAGADDALWWTLEAEASLLGEAAPRAFLLAMDEALKASPSPFVALFDEDDSVFSSGHHVTGYLHALETLAWSPTLLGGVTSVLASLSVLDPGGRQGNRPSSSLRTIFLPWSPQTFATLEQRLRIIDRLRESHPTIAWKTMHSIAPQRLDTAFPTALPRWRDVTVANPEIVTQALLARAREEIIARLTVDVGLNASRWSQLIPLMANLPESSRGELREKLLQAIPHIEDTADRANLRDTIRSFLHQHRSYPQSTWALREEELTDLDRAYDTLEPDDPFERVVWAFSPGCRSARPKPSEDFVETETTLMKFRVKAVSDLMADRGIDALFALARRSGVPAWIAEAMVEAALPEDVQMRVMTTGLQSEQVDEQKLAGSLVSFNSRKPLGEQWGRALLENARSVGWDGQSIVRMLLAFPGIQWTWDLATELGNAIEQQYWQNATIVPPADARDEIAFACQKLVAFQRATSAVHLLGHHARLDLPIELSIAALRAALNENLDGTKATDNDVTMFGYHVTELLSWLDSRATVERSELARLEWAYFPLLQDTQYRSRNLEHVLATDPSFFMMLLKLVYEPSTESGVVEPEPEDPKQAEKLASHAWNVLHDWDRVPGSDENGAINSDALRKWVKDVRAECAANGRLEVGDTRIGDILAAAKSGEDGSWPPQAVREIIESTRSKDLESGIALGVYNRRGVTTRGAFDGGQLERELVEKYRQLAERLGQWPRTAAMLEEISRSYDADAKRADEYVERRQW